MRIIRKDTKPSGAYYNIENNWCGETPPNTHYEVANNVDLSCGGFGTLTIVDNIVTAFAPDETAWNAWQAEHKPPTPEPTTAERNRADIDFIAIMTGVSL